jgi:hypothetical protein
MEPYFRRQLLKRDKWAGEGQGLFPLLEPQYVHCCQIPPGLLGQFSQKNSAAGEKIRPQAGHPPNHLKKCSKKFLLQIFGPIFANYC